MAKKSKINYRQLLIETFFIVFAVLLALVLNEWRTAVKEQDTVDKVLENIINEIEANKKDLEVKYKYHLKTSQEIGRYLANDSLWGTLQYNSGVEAVTQLMPKGIYNPNMQSGAWDSAVLSGVVNSFDYEVLYTLSNLYQVQESGPNSTWKIIAGFYSEADSFNRENARQLALRFQLAFGELYNQERSLLNNYEDALKTLQQ